MAFTLICDNCGKPVSGRVSSVPEGKGVQLVSHGEVVCSLDYICADCHDRAKGLEPESLTKLIGRRTRKPVELGPDGQPIKKAPSLNPDGTPKRRGRPPKSSEARSAEAAALAPEPEDDVQEDEEVAEEEAQEEPQEEPKKNTPAGIKTAVASKSKDNKDKEKSWF